MNTLNNKQLALAHRAAENTLAELETAIGLGPSWDELRDTGLAWDEWKEAVQAAIDQKLKGETE